MMITMTKEIQVEDYPGIDPSTEDGKEQFTLLASEMSLHDPTLTYFVFKRGSEVIGEMYLRDGFDEGH
jgi:hypothetical protein